MLVGLIGIVWGVSEFPALRQESTIKKIADRILVGERLQVRYFAETSVACRCHTKAGALPPVDGPKRGRHSASARRDIGQFRSWAGTGSDKFGGRRNSPITCLLAR